VPANAKLKAKTPRPDFSPLADPLILPAGWRAIYRVRSFCETDSSEPQNDFGWNDYETAEEALAFVRYQRTKAVSTRTEIVLISPTVFPFPSVIRRKAAEIADYKARCPARSPSRPTPDLATALDRYEKRAC
jgi:hypothetical protein